MLHALKLCMTHPSCFTRRVRVPVHNHVAHGVSGFPPLTHATPQQQQQRQLCTCLYTDHPDEAARGAATQPVLPAYAAQREGLQNTRQCITGICICIGCSRRGLYMLTVSKVCMRATSALRMYPDQHRSNVARKHVLLAGRKTQPEANQAC
jgi:hypothetical protein